MYRLPYFFFTLLFIGLTSIVVGQTYPGDPEPFVKELDKRLTNTNRELGKEVMDYFQPLFLERYAPEKQKEIISIVNKFDEFKLRSYPDMFAFVQTLIYMDKNTYSEQDFQTFQSYIGKLTQTVKQKKDLQDYLEFTENFFNDNTFYATKTGSVKWFANNKNYTFRYDEEPIVSFKKFKLTCYSKNDSLSIYETSGDYYVISQKFVGKGGKSLWNQSGFKPEEVFAIIDNYEVDIRKPEFETDSALFTNKFYFNQPLIGRLEDKVLAVANEDRRSYPRFTSYNARIPIRNIVEGVDYDGGFAQHGKKFLGAGTDEIPANIIIKREGKPQMIASAKQFLITLNGEEVEDDADKKKRKKEEVDEKSSGRIVSADARIIIVADTDSIVHPGLRFTLLTDDRVVNLVRNDDDLSASPYFDNFHQVEMTFELLTWKIDEPLMKFTSFKMTGDKKAQFTSNLFYKQYLYDQMMGAGSRNPLAYLKLCVDKWGTRDLTLLQCSECVSLPPTQVEPMMYRYQVKGYVDYDDVEKVVHIQEKLVHQVLSRSRKTDYDVIQINSDMAGGDAPNAKLNLMNYDLTIDGISRIILSDSHNVQIFPTEGRIVMKKNRDFDFSGMVAAGKAEFFGKEFQFSYNDFTIDMPIIDSLQLWASTERTDKYGNELEARVQTLIEDLRGDLVIDRPNNKSGRSSLKMFPKFTSTKESYAYYDQRQVHNKVYDRNKFYFQLEPFVFDSLDNFKNEDIKLKGTLVSADIFPDIEENLVLQSDYSLGFTQKAPSGGYPAYGGKGTFENIVDLSNKGLRGKGTLKYINSTAVSESFTFFPDSTNGVTNVYELEGQMGAVENPEVNTDTAFVHWMPYKDYMDVSSIEGKKPISMYTGIAEHTGTIRYSPTGLVGWGKNHFEGANLYSDMMTFKFTELLADTSDFEIPNDLLGDVNFSSENLQAHVNFQTREAKFISNTGASKTDFGQVQYMAYLDRFTWKMDSEEIEYSAEGKAKDQGADRVEVEGAEFISINPKQDSLRWNAKGATYNYKESIIDARGIEFIDVADASIIPGDGKATVRAGANMDQLDSARIVANKRLKYHNVYNAHVKINSRWNYMGDGKYDYKDENSRVQVITFNTVSVDSSRQTYGDGIISEEANFTLSPVFKYKGDVRLEANEKNLLFNGESQISHSCSEIPLQWFRFKSIIDPNDINIQITTDAKNSNGLEISSSAMIPVDSSMYGTFVSSPKSVSDLDVIPVDGYLIYDKPSKEYRISTLQKLNERSLTGNYVALKTETCVLEGEGQMTITGNTPHMQVKPVGTYEFNTVNKEFTTDMLLNWEFLFDDGLWDIIIKEIKAFENPKAVNLERPIYTTALREYVGQEAADDMIGRMSLGKAVKVPDQLKGENYSALVFSDIALEYNQESETYMAKDQLGIGNIGKEMLNVYVGGGIEFDNKRTGTDMFLYLDLEKNWYVFKYRASSGIMQVYSSNDEFNAAVNDVKMDKRRIKASKANRQFVYQIGSKRMRSEALSKFEGVE